MIEHIVITGLLVIGYCCTFWEGMIFGKIADRLDARLPEWISKPLYACYICACMWIGSAAYWLIWGTSWQDWLITCIGAMGMNAALSKLFND